MPTKQGETFLKKGQVESEPIEGRIVDIVKIYAVE